MRFMCLYRPDKKEGTPPTPQEVARMGEFMEKSLKSGALLETGGLQASSKGARVRLARGRFTVTDGPFAEAKELIAGFAILQAKSKEEAIEMTRSFLEVAGDGETEVRLMYEPSDLPS
jgi:hypothetical protein